MKDKRLTLVCLVLGLTFLFVYGCRGKDNGDYLPIKGKTFKSDRPDEYGIEKILVFYNNATCVQHDFNKDEGTYSNAAGNYTQNKDYIFMSWSTFGDLHGYEYSFDGKNLTLMDMDGKKENYIFTEFTPDYDLDAEQVRIEKLVGRFELKADEGDTSFFNFVNKENLIYEFNEDGTCNRIDKDTKEEKRGIFTQSGEFVFICWNGSLKDLESCIIDGKDVILAKQDEALQVEEEFDRVHNIRRIKLISVS